MDGQRFDAWTRLFARGLPRRDAIKVVVGAGVAGAVTRALSDETAAACEHFEGVCSKREDCCTNEGLACINALCLTCFAEHTSCQPHPGWGTQCCNGLKCDSHELKCVKDPDVKCEGRDCRRKKKHKKKKKH